MASTLRLAKIDGCQLLKINDGTILLDCGYLTNSNSSNIGTESG